jgi:TolB-like protein
MILRFEPFELDPARFELRRDGEALPIEPQVLSLLLLLASNPDRLVSKDEMIEKIWDGRIVSEAAVAARIKSARRIIGDDGKQQRFIRTIHGRGFRFVGTLEFRRVGAPAMPAILQSQSQLPATSEGDGRPSIAVLPFRMTAAAGQPGVLADALSDELIADLSRLRWLMVIARGSSFRFRGPQVDCRAVGNSLGVRYCLTGSLSLSGPAVTISVELVDAANGEVLWAETFSDAVGRILDMRREIGARVMSALEIRIPTNEARHARQHAVETLDAWSAYHLGLDHMFRFNRADNAIAAGLFERAIGADGQFARAYAGLSFTRFQNAFLNYGPDRGAEIEEARTLAEQALHRDRLDPFCHLNMGRSLWLDGNIRESLDWLEQATAISPSYAQGVYSKAWAKTLLGEADGGESDALLALQLSPLDPLRYAMLATRALSHVMRGNYEEGAILGERAARSPGAHKHIAVIAAIASSLNGQADSAAEWIARAKRSDPNLTGGDFLKSFPFAPSSQRETIERTLAELRL